MDKLKKLFEQSGLQHEVISLTDTDRGENPAGIHASISILITDDDSQQEDREFNLIVVPETDGFGDQYIRFSLVRYVELPERGFPTSLYVALGRINHELPALKFSFDEDDDLCLSLHVREERLDEDEFAHALQVLADYAGSHYRQILILAGE